MVKKWIGTALVVMPMAIGGGLVVANSLTKNETQVQANQEVGYICPATGEELPCRNCCPLNNGK